MSTTSTHARKDLSVKTLGRILPLLGLILGLGLGPEASAKSVQIKLGTMAPEGSVWHQALMRVKDRWSQASGGEVQLRIYPGGVAGDEGDMVRKMKVGQLHSASLTGVGMGKIHRSTIALQIPMLIESWGELDYVRDHMAPDITKELEKEGFVVLNWGDVGWVHHFSKTPAASPAEFRALKYFVWNGDPAAEQAWRKADFKVVPLSSTDVMSSLQTGMIEAFGVAPLFALSSQWFGLAQNMVRVNWTPLNGATIVAKAQWEKIEPGLRAKLLTIAQEEGAKLKVEARTLNEKAVTAMQDRGLKVVEPSAAVVAEWKKVAELAYPDIRGAVVPEQYFDMVKKYVEEYRQKQKS